MFLFQHCYSQQRYIAGNINEKDFEFYYDAPENFAYLKEK